MDIATAVGSFAAFCTTVSYFPQLKKCWETGHAGDLSLKMFSILAAGIALWSSWEYSFVPTITIGGERGSVREIPHGRCEAAGLCRAVAAQLEMQNAAEKKQADGIGADDHDIRF